MMSFYQFCFGFIQRRRIIFKSNAKLFNCIANDMQVLCKTMPSKEKKSKAKKRKANKRKAKKRKAKQIKQKQTKIIFKFVCEF